MLGLRSRVKIRIDDSLLSFRCPFQSFGSPLPHFSRRRIKSAVERYEYDYSASASDMWGGYVFFTRQWQHSASWIPRCEDYVSMAVSIQARKPECKLGGESFFHAKSFEFALANFLDHQYGHRMYGATPRYAAPVAWKVRRHLPVCSASFEVHPDTIRTMFALPIGSEHFVLMSFAYIGIRDPYLQSARQRVEEVIDSVRLELSDETRRQVERIKAESGDIGLREDFPPLQWPVSLDQLRSECDTPPKPQPLFRVQLPAG